MNKLNNNHECSCGGYKLSCTVSDVGHSDNVVQVYIGCDDDDTFMLALVTVGACRLASSWRMGRWRALIWRMFAVRQNALHQDI